jgi:hypothetical protein
MKKSSAEFRSWGALRPRVEAAPVRPLTADELLLLRVLPINGERPLSTAQLAIELADSVA